MLPIATSSQYKYGQIMLLHLNVPTVRPPWKIQQFFWRSFRVAGRSNKGAEEDKNTTEYVHSADYLSAFISKDKTQDTAESKVSNLLYFSQTAFFSELLGMFVDSAEEPYRLPEPPKLNLFVRDSSSLKACTETSAEEMSKCPVFDSLEVLELSLLSSIPLNQFDEWLQWTQEGKMWRFPIDNE
ncbi:hypothetical protein X801_08415, partial [Opisthorchis viverrini]